MTDTLPSSSTLKRLLAFAPLLALSFVLSSGFTTPTPAPRPARAYDAKMIQLREYITGYAQNFLGIRYRYAGRGPSTGFDCSGFTSYILKEFDVKVSSSSYTQSKQGNLISLDDVMPGDLVFFGRKGRIQHVAMVVECSAEGIICVHSTCSRGIVVENISTSKYWKSRIMFARDVITDLAPVQG